MHLHSPLGPTRSRFASAYSLDSLEGNYFSPKPVSEKFIAYSDELGSELAIQTRRNLAY